MGVAADGFLYCLQGQVGAFLTAGAMEAALSGLAMWLCSFRRMGQEPSCVPLSLGRWLVPSLLDLVCLASC